MGNITQSTPQIPQAPDKAPLLPCKFMTPGSFSIEGCYHQVLLFTLKLRTTSGRDNHFVYHKAAHSPTKFLPFTRIGRGERGAPPLTIFLFQCVPGHWGAIFTCLILLDVLEQILLLCCVKQTQSVPMLGTSSCTTCRRGRGLRERKVEGCKACSGAE